MSRNRVMVEIVDGTIVRICKRMLPILGGEIREWPRSEAVKAIRKQVWNRCRGECSYCGAYISEKTGEMHEKLKRSLGGEISVENSIMICHGCHSGRPDSEHGDRRWNGDIFG